MVPAENIVRRAGYCHVGDALHIEAVDEEYGQAQQEGANLERTDFLVVDDLRYAYRLNHLNSSTR